MPSLKICSREKLTSLHDECGQSTIEAALILLVFLSFCAFLAFMWHRASGGDVSKYALDASSHQLEGGIGGLQDIISF